MFLVRKFMYPDGEGAKNGDSAPEGKKESEVKPEETDKVALAKALKEARENTVSKEEYEKVLAENKALVSEIINGEGSGDGQKTTPEQQKASIEELREKLYGPKCSELSNLDFWKYTLDLRDEVIKKGDPDPFLPVGTKISPTSEDVEKANNVADVVRQCIDEAGGNSEVFTALLQSRTNPDSPQLTLRLKKLGVKYK